MLAHDFWKTVTVDRANLLDELLGLLDEHDVLFCVVGGQAVNAYAEPVVSLDLDLAIAVDQLAAIEPVLSERFRVEHFAHSVNVSAAGSDLRVQFRTDARYAAFAACQQTPEGPRRHRAAVGDSPRPAGTGARRRARSADLR